MKQPPSPVLLAGLATRALEIVAQRASLFRRAASPKKRTEELTSMRILAMHGVEHGALGEIDEFRQKGAALLVCGIDDALRALSVDASDMERLLLSSKKKLESARHTLETIQNEE
jgi:hypothetical protein